MPRRVPKKACGNRIYGSTSLTLAVWEGGADFSNLAVFSHTDLNRKGDFPERFQRVAELADVVVIDEAHHFRNPGTKGDPDTGEGRSRYHKLYDLQVFLLVAPSLVPSPKLDGLIRSASGVSLTV